MALLKLSTAYTRMFLLIDSADHVTGKTGVSPTVTISKAGAAFGAVGGTVTEVSSGWYKVAYTTTDTNTLGELAVHVTGASCDPTDFVDQVSTRLADDLAFPATSGRSMVVDAAGLVDANTVKVGPTGSGTAQTARDIGNAVPAAVAGAAGGLFIAGTNAATVVTGSLTTTFTGNLTGSVGSVTGAVGSVTGAVGSVTGNVSGNVTGSVGSVVAAVTVGTNNDKTGYALSGAGVTAVQTGLSTVTTAQVNTEVLDVLTVDTFAEPGAVPAATASLKDKIGWLATLARNKRTTTSAVDTVRNDADNASIATSAISDDGTTFTRAEYS